MQPYLNFNRHLRQKYGGSLSNEIDLDQKTFDIELSNYLRLSSEYAYKAKQEMRLYGMIGFQNGKVRIRKTLLD